MKSLERNAISEPLRVHHETGYCEREEEKVAPSLFLASH